MGEVKLEDKKYTEAEYFELLENSDVKLEYHAGYIRAMAGGTPEHSRIAGNTQAALYNALLEKECSVFNSDLAIYIDAQERYYFPDIAVVCGEEETVNNNFIKNPSIIVEVASKSTANFDKGAKMLHYFSIPSLLEYIIIQTDSPVVVIHSKNEKGAFETLGVMGLESQVHLPNFALKIKMRDIYRRVAHLKEDI